MVGLLCENRWLVVVVMSVGVTLELTHVQLQHCVASVSQHPTNHYDKNFDFRNKI